MNVLKKIITVILALIFSALLIAPAGVLYVLSDKEKQLFETPPDLVLKEYTYGEAMLIDYRTITETIVISGTVVSRGVDFIELSTYEKPEDIRFIISYGDYVAEDSVIGYLNGEELKAGKTGIVRSISYGEKGYVMLDSISSLALECYVDETKFNWRADDIELRAKDGTIYNVLTVDLVNTLSKGTRVLLAPATGELIFGTQYDNMVLETQKVYKNVLTVNKKCVYQYPNNDKQYVRIVKEYGEFVGEYEVKTGFSDDVYISISGMGIEAGLWCDSGYKLVVGG